MTLNTDNAVAPNSNLMNSDDLTTSVRDVTAENRAKGHFNEVSTYIEDHEFNNNLNVVIRDGSRVHSGGELRPNDLVMVNGMTMEYETAQAIGAITDGQVSTPQDDFYRDAENFHEAEIVDDRPAEMVLLNDQLTLAFGEQAEDVLQVVGEDIARHGEISEHGLDYFQRNMHLSPQQARETISEMEAVGNRALQGYLNSGDGYELDRVAFLADLAETGTRAQRQTVRDIWFKAATGKITRDEAVDAFNGLVEPYV